MSTLSSATIDSEILKNYSAQVQADCRTIAGEIARDAAVVMLDGTLPPYALGISLRENAMLLDFSGREMQVRFSLLRGLMNDYDLMIGAHGSALRHQLGHSRSEAIDMGRRAMHNEGAEMILKELSPYLTADLGTARLLFTLMFLLTQRR